MIHSALTTMASGGNEILTLFLSSFQAAISVLLTLSYGILATRLKFIDQKTSKDISQLCVNMFLPALLITNIGKELKLANLTNYIPVFRNSPPLIPLTILHSC